MIKAVATLCFLMLWSAQAEALLWRLGAVTPDSLNIFATTGDRQKTITVQVPGVGDFFVLESVWTDTSDGSPEDTYYAVVEIAGLQPWTNYTYTILEDGVEAGSGSFRTLPADHETPFEIALIGCDNSRSDGLYDMIANRSYARGGSLIAIIHVDDLGYLDTRTVADVEGITSTGLPRDTKLAYDYVGAWLEPLGKPGAQDDDKLWVLHNIPTFWIWGDHEVNNDFMNSSAAISLSDTGTRAAGEHPLGNELWVAANAAYSKVAQAAPPYFDLPNAVDGVSGKTYAYGFDIGPIRFFLHDRNSAGECHDCVAGQECPNNVCGEIVGHEPYLENFGKTQIEHMKPWLDDATHPFKIVFSGITIGGHSVTENQPWMSWWPDEFADFESWVDSAPNLNGASGNFIYVAGDRHNFAVHKRAKSPPQNGNADFMEYYVGTINGTNNHTIVPLGEVENGCQVIQSESAGVNGHDHWLTVVGAQSTELSFTSWNKEQREIFHGTLRFGAGNHFVEEVGPIPGLDIFDVSNPLNPTLLGQSFFGGAAVAPDESLVYLADGARGLQVLDVANRGEPTFVASADLEFARDIAMSDDFAYVSGDWHGLSVVDITNPTAPVVRGAIDAFGHASLRRLEVSGNYVHAVAGGEASLQVMDIADPDRPRRIGWLGLEAASSVAMDGGYAYVADGVEGLKIVLATQQATNLATGIDEIDFIVSPGLPAGVYDVTAVNPDGTVYKAVNALTVTAPDSDGDGFADTVDNCTLVVNSDQRDTNSDGYGNVCDPDLNNDNVVNFIDVSLWVPFFNTATSGDADFNGDGFVNFSDFAIIPDYFLLPPGPSGLAP